MKTIALCADYGYLDKVETAIKSILYNNQYVKIYLLNYDIPQEWFVNINQYINQIGSQVVDAKFNHESLNELHGPRAGINEMTFARFLIPELVDEDRVLYLDSDLIVDDSIDELFKMPFNNKQILGVADVFSSDDHGDTTTDCPINAGVLLLDNDSLKREKVSPKLIKLSRNNYENGDQQLINEYFKRKIGLLPHKYNHQVGATYFAYSTNNDRMVEILRSVKHPKIIHYVMKGKPSDFYYLGIMREKWWFYRNLELSKLVQKFTIFDSTKIKKSNFNIEALTFTYSADLQNIEVIIKKLPEVHFNIAAWTEMAPKLLNLLKYPNVTVYPAIIYPRLQHLIKKCNLYLDINYYQKDTDVLKQIQARDIPIMSFDDTANKEMNYSQYKIFGNDQTGEMVRDIKKLESME